MEVIELPAEANPLTEGILYHVLRSAASSNPHQIQTGTKQLQKWETEKHYYSLLQTVFIDKSLPFEVRYLAIIQLKNGIDKYWRKTAANAVSKEDRELIRSRLLSSGFNETDRRLALQNALMIAKVVRFEFPNDWPDALSSVIQALRSAADQNGNQYHLSGALLILHHVVKELSTARLQSKRASLQSITPEILHVLGGVYLRNVQQWQAYLGSPTPENEREASLKCEQSLLCIKILRRLVVSGYEHPSRDKDVPEFWKIVRSQLEEMLSALPSISDPGWKKLIEKHLMQLAKLHLTMTQTHAVSFVFLPDSLDLVRAYWGLISRFSESYGASSADISNTDGDADPNDKSIEEKLSLKGLLIIRACIKMVFHPFQTFKYRQPQDKEEKTAATEMLKTQLLTESFSREVMEVLVTRFFVLRASDIREWEEDPDEWEKREETDGEGFEYSVRPCAEKLFLDLATHYKSILVEPLLQVFYSIASPENENILFKDSVYTAIGLAAAVLHEKLDFDAFISNTLVPEVQIQKPGYNIIRRRIAIILGNWISIKVSKPSRPLVYQIFQHLLDKSQPLNDQIVRVTAGKQFKKIADDWEFTPEDFLPYAPETLSRLMALIEEMESTETKMALLNTISVIVERMEHNITPYADRIVSLLPPLWEQSGEEHLMKQAILTILTRLISAMKAASKQFHPLVFPIIKGAVEPGSETQVYLLDDALDLWAAIIAQTEPEQSSPELLSLAEYLLHILTLGSEAFRKALEITESYILLSPTTILSDNFRARLISTLSSLLGELKADASGFVTSVVELLIRAADGLGGGDAVKVLVGDMLSTGFFSKLLHGLKGAWEAHQTTGPNRRTDGVDGIVETDYFSILARVGVVSPELLLSALANATGESEEVITKWLLEEWFSHIENMGDSGRRKLTTMALTRFLELNKPWILGKLQDLMTVWTDLVMELTEGNDDKTVDSLVYWPPAPTAENIPEAPEDTRRRQLLYSDPIHSINIVQFIRERLKATIDACGGQEVFQNEWLVNVDRDIVTAFGSLGIM